MRLAETDMWEFVIRLGLEQQYWNSYFCIDLRRWQLSLAEIGLQCINSRNSFMDLVLKLIHLEPGAAV